MAKVKKEFRCTNCSKYFDIKLNYNLNGNYRIHCPNCGHVHYRAVRNGAITEDRFPVNDCEILIEDIYPMKSSCRDYQKEVAEDSDFCTTDAGFMKRLWSDRFSGRVI